MGLNCVRSISARLRINGEEKILWSRKQPSVFSNGVPEGYKVSRRACDGVVAAIFFYLRFTP